MKPKSRVADPVPEEAWTRPETYLGQLARKRTYRRSREGRGRTQPESPRLLLSTMPFLALIGLLAILAVAIMIAAFPGNQPGPKAKTGAQREPGVAQKGWFQEAQKEMHH
ncbi:MAG: hypothetical protein JO317_03580 [Verrucomicrobiae bacterium]|nr:hypothetical protein [Verrucomicrobiae bacterium]